MTNLLDSYHELLPKATTATVTGRVVRTQGLAVAVGGFAAPLGALASIDRAGAPALTAEVVGFRDELTWLYPLDDLAGVRHGQTVRLMQTARHLRVGPALLGRIIDAKGRVLDQRAAPHLPERAPLYRAPPPVIERRLITEPLPTGIRVLDSLLTFGRGQRMGIFAGSGVGKSVLLGMISRYARSDVNVIALLGERGREVNEFLVRDLGAEGLARSVVVVATSDEPAQMRAQAALTATAVAEYFRDQGKNVLLMMDSLTRYAMALREIGLAAGEPPATRGYPPSVFGRLPQLVERAGQSRAGSITALYSVLVEGDDLNEPVSDAVRGLLDGHTVLSRDFAARGHYPAVDVLESISRVMPSVTTPRHQEAARTLRGVMAAYREHEDLIQIGAYRAGANAVVDQAIAIRDELDQFLKQDIEDAADVTTTTRRLEQLAEQCARGPVPPPATPEAGKGKE